MNQRLIILYIHHSKKPFFCNQPFIFTAFATAFGDFVMHPIDTIKIMQQTAENPISLIETAKLIFTKSGIGGFYPGVVPYLIADGLSGAMKFATFELSRTALNKRIPEKYHPFSQFLCAAGVS